MLIYVWFCLGLLCFGVPAIYFAYMRKISMKPWNLKTDPHYQPSISIIIPTFNEGNVIQYKLQNLARLDYPKDLIQIITVDSASTDHTLKEIEEFKEKNSGLNIVMLKENERRGKSSALNFALKYSEGKVIIVSDADCFWPSDILKKAIPYLADNSIGAVAGQEKLLNPKQSWVTETENVYRDNMFKVQLGESKFSSTVQFEGGFGAYDRRVLDQFDVETGSDDSGTALNVTQKGVRTIVLPQAIFYTFFPPSWRGKLTIKLRRTKQLVRIWSKCFRLMVKGKLVLPKRIFLPEAFFFLVSPALFAVFFLTSILLFFEFPALAVLPVLLLAIPKTRLYLIEAFQNYFIALLALIAAASGKGSIVWAKAEDSRKNFEVEILRNNGLIS